MLVSGALLSVSVSGECLPDDPGEIFPQVVLHGHKSDLVNITLSFVTSLLSVLEVGKSHLDRFTGVDKSSNEIRCDSVKLVLGSAVGR